MKTDRLRVFVFDDEAAVRRLLVKALESWGYEVFAFSRASLCDECRCLPGEACADIVVSDIAMPGIKGTDFAEHQKGIGCRNPHIALMSGNWSPSDYSRARKLGCRILRKPFTMVELRGLVSACARESAAGPGRQLISWFHQVAPGRIWREKT